MKLCDMKRTEHSCFQILIPEGELGGASPTNQISYGKTSNFRQKSAKTYDVTIMFAAPRRHLPNLYIRLLL